MSPPHPKINTEALIFNVELVHRLRGYVHAKAGSQSWAKNASRLLNLKHSGHRSIRSPFVVAFGHMQSNLFAYCNWKRVWQGAWYFLSRDKKSGS